jgi:hypothetical protein
MTAREQVREQGREQFRETVKMALTPEDLILYRASVENPTQNLPRQKILAEMIFRRGFLESPIVQANPNLLAAYTARPLHQFYYVDNCPARLCSVILSEGKVYHGAIVFDSERESVFAAVIPSDCLTVTEEWTNPTVEALSGRYAFTFLSPIGFIHVKQFFAQATENGEVFHYIKE